MSWKYVSRELRELLDICDRRSCKIAKISEDYDLRGTRKPSCGTIWHVLHERGLWDFIDCD